MVRTISVTTEFPPDVLDLIDRSVRNQLTNRSARIRGAVLRQLREQFPTQVDRVLQAPLTISRLARSVAPES